MNCIVSKLLCCIIFIFVCDSITAQGKRTKPRKKIEKFDDSARFSFYQKLAFLKTQLDGDNLMGYDKNGFEITSGVNYRFSNLTYLNIGVHYMSLGSRKPDPYQNAVINVTQLGANMNVFGAQFGIIVRPKNNKIYISNSLLFNKITSFSAFKYTVGNIEEASLLLDPLVKNSFWSNEFVIGTKLVDNLSVYLAVNFSLMDLLDEDHFDLRILRPYHLGFGICYRVIP